MSEVKKLIISRKKIDQHGNEYALIKISSNHTKRPEIRVLKFKKSPKKSKSKSKPNNEENTSTKTYSSHAGRIPKKLKEKSNSEIVKKNLKGNISNSPIKKNYIFNNLIQTFNNPSKNRNVIIFNLPSSNNYNYTQNIQSVNSTYLNNPNLNNYVYSFNSSRKKILQRNKSEFLRTDFHHNTDYLKSEFIKKIDNLNNRINILTKTKRDYNKNIKNLKLKESKLKNKKVNGLKEKQNFKNDKYKAKCITEGKKQINNIIKNTNKDTKKKVNEINIKKEILKRRNMAKVENKNKIHNLKKENVKNRFNYLKSKKKEENTKNQRRIFKNFSTNKFNNIYSFTKTMIEEDFKDIEELKKKYEKLKLLDKEYSEGIKQINKWDGKRSFSPLFFNLLTKKNLAYNKIELDPKKVISNKNSIEKNLIEKMKQNIN